ncbi:MAG: hypothetical protein KDB12_16065, partial [Ilumatobacter sp.]|nr:hypothetical protein [Ilumatobacter sp.]
MGKRQGQQRTPSPGAGGWGLLRATLRRQRRALLAGVLVGLLWSAGKVMVPKLTSLAVDKGILEGGSLWLWAFLLGATACIA